jgi:hypothetical protein
MQCPKCQRENFEIEKPCAYCGFQGDSNRLAELGYLQRLLNEMNEWETLDIDAASLFKLKEFYTSHLKDMQVLLGLRQPSFTSEEVETAEKVWIELAHLETLFEKVEEWRGGGYFKMEMDGQDPVKMQRAHADALRQRLEGHQRLELSQTDQDRLKTVSFLLDQIDLLASRGWFKSKREIEKAVAPIMAVMIDVMSEDQGE